MVELKMALGAATKTDLLETRVRLSQAEQGLARTEHGRALAEMNLKNLLGLTGDEELILAELPAMEKDLPLPALEEATGTALECRKELAGLRYYLAIAEENLRMAKGFWKPTVALVGNYAESQSKSPGLSDPTLTVTLGLEASLFSGGGKLADDLVQCLGLDGQALQTQANPAAFAKVTGQQRYIIGALPQRRGMDRKHT